jgi:hypothetical protein
MSVLKQRLPNRLTPLAARLGYRPFYGDIHNHCNLSYGHGSPETALKRARRQLDFVSVTGHAHWPDMPVDDPRVAHIVDFHKKGFARLEKTWPEHFELLAAYDQPGRFTVFPGYEIHSSAYGDYTIVYRDLDQRELLKADSPADLRSRLDARYPGRTFAFPHHIGYRLGARGINWSAFDEDLSPVLEMISMHGCSESSLGDRPFLHSMGPSDGRSTVRYGLGRGLVFGLIGNTDHHSGYPGSYGHGRSCVYAAENTRDDLWDAFRKRRTNALTGDCTHLFAAIDDHPQGSIIAPRGPCTLRIEAVGGSFIEFIDVVRNGRVASRITPELAPRPIDAGGDSVETLLVLELGWGARGKTHDWTGSIELVDSELLAVEPRLRGAEVVSPLEGSDEPDENDRIACSDDRIEFRLLSRANPNNMTPATQAICARVRVRDTSVIRATFDGQTNEVSAARLFEVPCQHQLSIDSPAYRFHPLPYPRDWQWHGDLSLGALERGDHVYVRMRQANGQWSWTSPIFCR